MTRFDVTALPLNMRTKIMVAVDQRLTNGTACWEWTGATNSKGYGSVTNGRGGSMLAHRKAWELLKSTIPGDLTIDHLCFNKLCMNTDHMEAVTRAENSRRKLAQQTHCKHGHPLSGENVYLRTRRDGLTYRVCQTCQRGWRRAWARKTRAAELEAVAS